MRWLHIDLHLHTPGSSDYQEPNVTYLDILRRAETRGLDVIAFTDHNTIAGYKGMMAEIDQLAMLERLERATPEERRRLAEYRRLMNKILVLPGFEFTATFGFHILGIFAPETPIRQLEHILLSLNIPPSTLDEGSSNVGASSDVLTAYRTINEAGGLVIAAHVNSSHGVAMRGFDFGGQTKIAYTQDPFLHALEVTDLDKRGKGITARFFDGTKPEYSRRMRCVQGSDAHRLTRDDRNEKNLGIGDRTTEVQVDECTFEAIKEIFQSADYARTRPYRGPEIEVYDYVQAARETGANASLAFHENVNKIAAIVTDICAMANTNGGTIYIGVGADPIQPPNGVDNMSRNMELLQNEISNKITPPLKVAIDAVESQNRVVLRVAVPPGAEVPYALDGSKIYVRSNAETTLAVRDEIVRLVGRSQAVEAGPVAQNTQQRAQTARPAAQPPQQAQQSQGQPYQMPRPQRNPPGRRPQNNGPRPASNPSPYNPQPMAQAVAPESAAEALPIVLPPDDFEDDAPLLPAKPGRDLPGAGGAPRTGVEIIGTETRKGEQHHIMRDLRDGKIVKNVTRSSARRLWQYAIIEKETSPVDASRILWSGDVGLLRRYRRAGVVRYDLVQRDSGGNGNVRVFYGVTDDGLVGPWVQFAADTVPIEEDTR